MVDEFSKVPSTCNIAINAEILKSTLEDEVVVGDFTRVSQSKLGNKVRIDRNNLILFSELGRYCYTGSNTKVLNAKVGKFNSISWNVSIGGNNHDMNKVTTHSFLVYPKWGMGANGNWKSVSEACELENDIWVAAGVNILRGVHIGSGAIIGAGTIVTKDVPPYAIVAGNPGKIIRMRCSDKIIEKMLELEWWNFPADIIRSNFKVFDSELTIDTVEKLFEIKEKLMDEGK